MILDVCRVWIIIKTYYGTLYCIFNRNCERAIFCTFVMANSVILFILDCKVVWKTKQQLIKRWFDQKSLNLIHSTCYRLNPSRLTICDSTLWIDRNFSVRQTISFVEKCLLFLHWTVKSNQSKFQKMNRNPVHTDSWSNLHLRALKLAILGHPKRVFT